MNAKTPIPDTQERLGDYEERLFWRAIEIWSDCEQLRETAEATGLPRDKAAYITKWRELRDAVIAHREAVKMCKLYEKSGTN